MRMMFTVVLAFMFGLQTVLSSDDDLCPTWHVLNSTSGTCSCQSLRKWVIRCNQLTQKVNLARGFCMTFDNGTGTTDVGSCPYTQFDQQHEGLQKNGYIELPSHPLNLSEFMCGFWNREGYLCSKCKAGYGLTVANVFQKCIKCKYLQGVGWLFYFMLQLIPLTILFLVVSVFHISLARPPLNAFVMFCHFSVAILFTRAYQFYPPHVMDSDALQTSHYYVFVGLEIWSMSLIRSLFGITDFCVESNINVLQAFSLTQIQSLFPLVLIALSYICVKLHARNCKLIVCIWRPFHRLFVCSRRTWNSKLSLVDVYSTFYLLSFSRFIIQLYYVLSFQYTYRLGSGPNQSASLLYDPSVQYFHPLNHLPIALVLLFIFLAVVAPPIILLTFYQFRAFHVILICLHLHKFPSIHIFVDLFHGYFKDGTCGSYDLRCSASLYLLLRIAVLLGFVGCNSTLLASCSLMLSFAVTFILLLFFAIFRPYKDERMNVIDCLFLGGLTLISFLLIAASMNDEYKIFNAVILSTVLVIVVTPQTLLYGCLLYKLCSCLFKLQCFREFVMRLRWVFRCPTRPEPVSELTLDVIDNRELLIDSDA